MTRAGESGDLLSRVASDPSPTVSRWSGAGRPEVFQTGGSLGPVRHAMVTMSPGPDDEAMELWSQNDECVARTLADGNVVQEARVDGDRYRMVDLERRSGVVRSGFADLDRRLPLRPVLEAAYIVAEGDGFSIRPGKQWLLYRTASRRVVSFVSRDPASDGISELDLDVSGLPQRAVIGGVKIDWTWTLDEMTDEFPVPMTFPDGCFVESYTSRLASPPSAAWEGGAVVADYDFETSLMSGPTRYLVLKTTDAEVVVSIGRRSSPWVPWKDGEDDFYFAEGDLFVHVLGSQPGSVWSVRDRLTAILLDDAIAHKVFHADALGWQDEDAAKRRDPPPTT